MSHAPHSFYKEIYNQDTGFYTLYHGTNSEDISTIIEEGLLGGDNTKGGTHGIWDNYILFMAKEHHVAEKYGTVLKIEIPPEEFEKLDMDKFNDGLGDRCYSLETDEFDEILIKSKFITQCDCEDCTYSE